MKRVNITLDDTTIDLLKRLKRATGASMSHHVREAVIARAKLILDATPPAPVA